MPPGTPAAAPLRLAWPYRQLELNRLKLADWLAKLLPLFRIADRGIQCALRHSEPERRDGNPATVEDFQACREAFALLAQQILRRHLAVREDDFRSVAGAQSQFVLFL